MAWLKHIPKLSGMPDIHACLLIGLSVRPLAASAVKAGIEVYAIDLFDDLDTRTCSVSSLAVEYAGGGLDNTALFASIEKLDPAQQLPVVYTGGFECNPDQIEKISNKRKLLGNSAAIIASIKNPDQFARALSELSIPAPKICFEQPGDDRIWLQKKTGSSGGMSIKFATDSNREAGSGLYFQEFKNGRIISATVLATDVDAQIVGFSEQWCTDSDQQEEFAYGGAVSIASESLPPAVKDSIKQAADSLVAHFGLRGLITMDMIVEEQDWWLLEVNPRPGFTFELHEGSDSLIGAHCSVFCGHYPQVRSTTRDDIFNAHWVVYAPTTWQVPKKWDWPAWVRDRPASNNHFEPGDPVCTVYATAASSDQARQLVEARYHRILSLIS